MKKLLYLCTLIVTTTTISAQTIIHGKESQSVDVRNFEKIDVLMWGSRLYKSEILLSDKWGNEKQVIKLDRKCYIKIGDETIKGGKDVNYGSSDLEFWKTYLGEFGFEESSSDKTGGKTIVSSNYATGQVSTTNTPTNYKMYFRKKKQ